MSRAAGSGVAHPGADLPYPITVARGALRDIAGIAAREAPAHRYAYIVDSTVASHHAAMLEGESPAFASGRGLLLTVPPGEREKTRARWAMLTDALIEWGAGRDTTIVAVGGGVVCDLAGFVAATFMRGVPVVQVPTTLLAMVDASVGGKTGVDTRHGKNLVGAFHNPSAVIADPDVLATLPGPVFRSGLAEMIKHGVLADARYFERLLDALPALAGADGAGVESLPALIADSIAIKAAVVAEDHRESGRRQTLNFGHTIAHALEQQAGFDMLHGDAVAIGMVVEAGIAQRLGLAGASLVPRVREAVVAAGLPASLPPGLDLGRIVEATHGDKKARAGDAHYALPVEIGRMAPANGRWAVPVADAIALAELEAQLV